MKRNGLLSKGRRDRTGYGWYLVWGLVILVTALVCFGARRAGREA